MGLVCVAHADNSRYLEHYGILGQRWGIRRTPQQLGHEPEGGKDYKVAKGEDPNADDKRERGTLGKVWNKMKTAHANRVAAAKKKERAKKMQEGKAKKKAEREAAEKEKAEIAKDPKKMLQNMDKFSDKEINDALNRYVLQADLEAAAERKTSKVANAGKNAVNATINAIDTAARGIGSAARLYDNFAAIYNGVYAMKTGAEMLPRVGTEENEYKRRRQATEDARRRAREDFENARADREHEEDRDRERRARVARAYARAAAVNSGRASS